MQRNPANSKTLGEKKIGFNFLTAQEENGDKMGRQGGGVGGVMGADQTE